jgi:adenylate cyclase
VPAPVRRSPRPRQEERRRKRLAALLLGLLPGALGILLVRWPLAASLEFTGLDLLFLLRGLQNPPSQVCIVALDDDSYSELGVPASGGWPRRLHARLIRTLKREGAKAIAFDVVFEGATEGAGDRDLAAAVSQAGNVVLGSRTEQKSDPRFREARVIDPDEPLARAAAAVGDVTAFRQERGLEIRRAWPVLNGRPSLGLAAYEVATDDRSKREGKERWIDYYGPARSIQTISYYQAVEPERFLPPGFFRDKIVFVGLSQAAAAGEAPKDAFQTPFSGGEHALTYGVEIHATVTANLLEGRRIDRPARATEELLLLVLPLITTFAFMYLRPLAGAVLFLALDLVPWIVAHLAFTHAHTWVPVMIPSVVQLPMAYVTSLIWYYLTTVRERERIRRAFSFYLSPEMIERIVADPAELNLGGEEIKATALFTDLKDFSAIAESVRPQEMARLLNAYFSQVTRDIFAEGGTLIKFIGDAAFAIWGAPVRLEDHATPACAAALALARAQGKGRVDDGSPLSRLVTRIGVHTGYMLVGNLGSEQRFDYTAIGDTVNVASRLEGLNKQFNTLALASGVTIFMTGGRFIVRRLGVVRVAGRSDPIEIFEILGKQGDTTVPDAQGLSLFERAVDDFAERRFEPAAEGFRRVLELCGGEDGPSRFYLRLCERHLKEPPPAGWDATIVFESK